MKSFVLDGLVDGVGTVVIFVPLMAVFFAAMPLIDDSGYLSRAAYFQRLKTTTVYVPRPGRSDDHG